MNTRILVVVAHTSHVKKLQYLVFACKNYYVLKRIHSVFCHRKIHFEDYVDLSNLRSITNAFYVPLFIRATKFGYLFIKQLSVNLSQTL